LWITTAAIVLIGVAVAIGGYYFAGSRNGADAAGQGGTPSAGNPQGGPASARRGAGGDASRPTPVAAMAARQGDFDVYLNALGTVTARSTVTVRSRVDGQLLRVLFNEGQVVKAGQLLAEIDPRPFQVQLEQMNGQLAKDQALLANAQVDLERYRTLLKQDSIASQQVDTQASLVRQYEATIASDKGQVDNAKLQLSFTKIAAPITGRLGLRQVDAGNMIHATDTNGLVVITQVQPIDVVFPIPESNLPRVQRRLSEGDPPVVDAYDRNQTRKLATGKLITIDNQIDTATGTIKLKAAFPNDDSALFRINSSMYECCSTRSTVQRSFRRRRSCAAPGTFVYVVKADKPVTVKAVQVGPIEGENAVSTAASRRAKSSSSTAPIVCARARRSKPSRARARFRIHRNTQPPAASAGRGGGGKGGGKGSEAPK
jgi:multidrug efflux system membrane fusion protein